MSKSDKKDQSYYSVKRFTDDFGRYFKAELMRNFSDKSKRDIHSLDVMYRHYNNLALLAGADPNSYGFQSIIAALDYEYQTIITRELAVQKAKEIQLTQEETERAINERLDEIAELLSQTGLEYK